MATALASHQEVRLVDLRDLRGADLEPLLAGQARRWRETLHWDFASAQGIIRRFLDGRNLYGYALASGGRLTGYCYFIYEAGKALLGDLYLASPELDPLGEELLLRRTLEAAAVYPGVRRIEGQLLDFAGDPRGRLLYQRPLEVFERLYMVRPDLATFHAPALERRTGRLRPWRDSDLEGAARLIAEAYVGHVDSRINDQYRTPEGAGRFVFNTIHHTGCGSFLAGASIVADRRFRSSPLGVCLCTRVASDAGHIAQICVDASVRRHGFGHGLLRESLLAMARMGFNVASLTVTASNVGAVRLYRQLGFVEWRRFPAFVWEAD
ncbi:MAG: GNAT family N-acetyltransferase [Acidobacteria bacterium]|nr:GNAT family N-acetyltransferase [Acidobacteriota bacterium]